MDATTVAIGLAKDVFELAFADAQGRISERNRLSRDSFARCLVNRRPFRVVMKACGSAHHWTRVLQAQRNLARVKPFDDNSDLRGRLNAKHRFATFRMGERVR